MTMRYNYAGIESAAGSIDKFIKAMDTELDAIETKLKPLEGPAWSGSDAQTAYFDLKSRWRQAALEIAEALINLKVKLGEGSDGMRAADVKGASYFGG